MPNSAERLIEKNAILGPGTLRLLLATLVMIHHTTPIAFGKFAVFAFFILSGYWIPKAYREKYVQLTTFSNILRFYAIRFWRLIPLFLTCTALTIVVFYCLHVGYGHESLPPHKFHFLLNQFALPLLNIIGASALPPAWSLDVEMQFYLLIPLLMASRTARIASFVFPFFVLGVNAYHPLPETYFSYSIFFSIGMAIYLNNWIPSIWLVRASIILILVMAFLKLTLFANAYQNWDALMAFAFTPVIALNVRTQGWNDKLLGDLSYSLYLFHWIPAYYLRTKLGFYASHVVGWTDASQVVLAWIISFAGALALLLLVDLPSERLRYWASNTSLAQRKQSK